MVSVSVRTLAPVFPYFAVGMGMLGTHNAWLALFGYHASMCLVLALDRRWGGARDLLRGWHAGWFAAGSLLGALGGVALYALRPWLGITPALHAAVVGLGLNKTTWPAFILYFCAVNPWLEELYWRGYLGDPARSLRPIDLWFAGYHLLVVGRLFDWPWQALAFAVLAGAAWFWRQSARASHGLRPAAVSHLAADVSIIIAAYFLLEAVPSV